MSTNTWTGADGNNSFLDSNNWSTGAVPDEFDDVVISASKAQPKLFDNFNTGLVDVNSLTISNASASFYSIEYSMQIVAGLHNVGTIVTLGGGLFTQTDSSNSGSIQIDGGSVSFFGTLTNSGTLEIDSSTRNTSGFFAGDLTLVGAGKIILKQGIIDTAFQGYTLTNQNNVISGQGEIFGLILTNQAGGMIVANGGSGTTLTIATGNNVRERRSAAGRRRPEGSRQPRDRRRRHEYRGG